MTAGSAIDIHCLGPTEIVAMRRLLDVFGAAFEDHERYSSEQPGDRYLADLLAKPTFISIVAMASGDVVGGLTAYVLDKPEREDSEIYIYDLAVTERYRRRGVATALIRRLQTIAELRGARVIFVQADLEDAPAIALYQKLGSQETAHHFDIEVPRRTPTRRTD
ncbi:MAG TPA: AAC(3)-I family aminoglycoside N-acetyltransferase [Hyphomicrobiaceae bacterium]|nr:AAC(3)-I family aminoglycoside N-acetyltransferase [Hyphomicrobiaceae bacterium]